MSDPNAGKRKYQHNDMIIPESTTAVTQPLQTGSSSYPIEVSVDLTSELRWFFDDPIPDELVSWFTHDAATGLTEVRCDAYLLNGAIDIGVKRRFKEVLELKVRQGSPKPFAIAPGLDGALETWQRWSPADGHVHLTDDTAWIDVHKTITKRRFTTDGAELPLSEASRAMTGQGCDVEIATLSIEGRPGWTFAFAAFGPVDHHRSLLEVAWAALLEGRGLPEPLRLHSTNSFGYPEWITKEVLG